MTGRNPLETEGVQTERGDCGEGDKRDCSVPGGLRLALATMQVNKNRTEGKQYLVCPESTKNSPGTEKIQARDSVAEPD